MRQHGAAPAHDDRKLCRVCRRPIHIPDKRFPCSFKHSDRSDHMHKFQVGDKVKIRSDVAGRWHGITFTVEKLLPKNVDLSSPHAPKGLRCAPSLLIAADAVDPTATPTTLPAGHGTIIGQPPLDMGTLVEFKNELYVVLAKVAGGAYHVDRYRIVKLGGDGGRYYTKVPRSQLTVVDVNMISVRVDV